MKGTRPALAAVRLERLPTLHWRSPMNRPLSRPNASLLLPLFLLLAGLATTPATAQPIPGGEGHRSDVPAPHEVLGYELGERFTPHHMLHRYFERVAEASPRVRLDTVAYTFEGRELLMAVVTGEANHARLAEIQAAARRLADPRGLSEA